MTASEAAATRRAAKLLDDVPPRLRVDAARLEGEITAPFADRLSGKLQGSETRLRAALALLNDAAATATKMNRS